MTDGGSSLVGLHTGEWREEMLAKVPTKDLNLDAELDVGTRLRLSNGLEAIVHEKTDETITIDANPPLAGQTLQFDVELLYLTKVHHKAAPGGMSCPF